MMGHQGDQQDELFYSFSLESHVPADHLLRGIDCCLDVSELRQQLASFNSHTGRPSIDPELMVPMLFTDRALNALPHGQRTGAPEQEPARRTRVATLFPNEDSLLRLVTAVIGKIDEDWATGQSYLKMKRIN